jgi:gliding motility-associated-like protein
MTLINNTTSFQHPFKRTLSVLALSIMIATSFGQNILGEICNNGIDDDGDGFIDCYDPDCSGAANCVDDYISEVPICEVPPTAFPSFAIKQQWASANGTTSSSSSFTIGDLDGDGFPEAVTTNYSTNGIYILNGITGATQNQVNIAPIKPWNDMIIADIDGDGCAEIFVVYSSSEFGIIAFDCNLNKLWQTQTSYNLGNIGITDFDGDGLAEIYGRDEIIDAHSGTIMAAGTHGTDKFGANYFEKHLLHGGVAVDVLAGFPGQELVQGGKIYAVDINRATLSASISLEESINSYETVQSPFGDFRNTGGVSVADYNQDGHLDILMPGFDANEPDPDHTRVFLWDVYNGTFVTYKDNANDWREGTGRLNVADIDGDGLLNTTFVSGEYLYALDENWNLKWRIAIQEESSGTTGATVFDFNGDGSAETVYRDEAYLYIVDGNDGDIYASTPCKSLTFVEYPIVADIDNDGATEICVPCLTDDAGDIYGNQFDAQIRVYESDGEQWVPARKVWNQHAYFNANINDDLTIPEVLQPHHQVFSTGVCGIGDNRPLNTFLNQSPFITYDGCPNYGAPDLTFVQGSLTINPPTCPDTDITISFEISNEGDKDLNFDVPISFYDGDPVSATSIQLNTVIEHLVIPKRTSITLNDIPVKGPGSAFELYVLINHNGTVALPLITDPNALGFNAPVGGIPECNPFNNLGHGTVTPALFSVAAQKISDNAVCLPSSAPSNGEAGAFVLVGGVENTTDYTFNWYNTAPPTGPVNHVGPSYSNLANGTYSVTAIHSNLLCASDTILVVIDHVSPPVSEVTINIIQDYSDCTNPNGALKAIVHGGAPEVDFEFEWYEGNNIGNPAYLVATSATATALNPILYSVQVTQKSTGCTTIATATVGKAVISLEVDVVIAESSTCGTIGNGSASANIDGTTTGYTFHWYDGVAIKPTADYIGPTYAALGTGDYTVTATDDASGCVSSASTVRIQTSAQQPTVSARVDTHLSCDPSIFTGALSADVGGFTAGFTFHWFSGQTTSSASEVTGSPAPNLTGLPAGIYTVQAIDDISQCFDTAEVTIDDNSGIKPIPSTTADKGQSICTIGAEDGQVSAHVGGQTVGFTFYWFDGDHTAGTPDINNPDFTGSTYPGLSAGNYTVVAIGHTVQCPSEPVIATVADHTGATTPTIATALTQQSSCESSQPNGTISAWITAGGVDADFSFQVFAGQNTLPANEVTGSPSTTVSALPAGSYTILATHNTTGCFSSAEVTIDHTIALPTISALVTPSGSCNPVDGFITATVDMGDLADYTFSWYDGPTIKVTPDYAETSNILSNLTEGTYTVAAVNNSTSCDAQNTVTLDFTADPTTRIAITQDPTQTIVPRGCTDFNGQLGVSASSPGNTAGFTFTWFPGDINTGLDPISDPVINGNNLNTPATQNTTDPTLQSGRYTVIVQDNDTGCSNSLVIDLPYSDIHTMQIDPIVEQTSCDIKNGAVTIEITPSVAAIALMGGVAQQDYYRINILQNGEVVQSAHGASLPSTNTTIAGLEAGDYTVIVSEANPALTHCSAHSSVTIPDLTVAPVVALYDNSGNSNCVNAPNGNGFIELMVDGLPTPATGYTYTWHNGKLTTDPLLPSANTPAPGHSAIGLTRGFYTVEVTATASSCPTVATFHLLDDQPIISLADITTTPDTNCSPDDGTAQVTTLSFGTHADYLFGWRTSDGVTPIPGAGNDPTVGAVLDGGAPGGVGIDYFVIATHVTNACFSSAKLFTITNTAKNPVINATSIIENTHCTSLNGAITIELDGGNPAADYTINWFDVASNNLVATEIPTSSVTLDGLMLSNIPSGNYRVDVEDNSPENAACTASATFFVPDNTPIISLVPYDMEVLPNDQCIAPFTGSAKINFVRENNTQVPAAGHAFQWFDEDMVEVPTSSSNTLTGLDAGTYLVLATSLFTECSNPVPVSFEIMDETVPPAIVLESFTSPTRCDGSNGLGTLTVTADGSSNDSDYTFAWYTKNQPVRDTDIPFEANATEVFDLAPGDYTVQVTNNASHCVTYESYTMVTQLVDIQVAISTTPNTSCELPNGSVFARVSNSTGNHDFDWYIGSAVTNTPDYSAQTVSNLPAGQYTVVATNQNNDLGCVSAPVVVTVDGNKVLSEIVITASPVTNCDPEKADGQLSASVDGQATGYTFDWYIGTNDTGTADYQGAIYSQLSGTTYTVRATSLLTSCSNTRTITLTESPAIIPNPTVIIDSDVTSCSSPNGTLSAFVAGEIEPYIFTWFANESASGSPIGLGAQINGLDIGTYSVLAEHRISGCTSLAVQEISDDRIHPEFEVVTTPSACGDSNGSIAISPMEGTIIERVEWVRLDVNGQINSDFEIVNSPYFTGHPKGDYQFTVFGRGECSISGQTTIREDIITNNGLSPNDDHKNEYFIVSCIEKFKNNTVKIYNRSGQLIYQATGYDNEQVKFTGIGNRGIYLAGKEIPSGTYFYIIDKNNGSAPQTGYLELMR